MQMTLQQQETSSLPGSTFYKAYGKGLWYASLYHYAKTPYQPDSYAVDIPRHEREIYHSFLQAWERIQEHFSGA